MPIPSGSASWHTLSIQKPEFSLQLHTIGHSIELKLARRLVAIFRRTTRKRHALKAAPVLIAVMRRFTRMLLPARGINLISAKTLKLECLPRHDHGRTAISLVFSHLPVLAHVANRAVRLHSSHPLPRGISHFILFPANDLGYSSHGF
jgi:hypothetical protein